MPLLAELKRRNVIRMAGLYLVGAWLITQVAGTVLPMFDAPGWLPRSIVILLAIGFVPTLIFSWIYELTPDGWKRDSDTPAAESIGKETGRRIDRAIIAVLLVALGYFAADKFVVAPRRSADEAPPKSALPAAVRGGEPPATSAGPAPSDASIAVLPFVNMSGKADEEYFSDGMTEEVLNVLAKAPNLKVAARTSVFEFKGKGGDVREIGRKLGVAHIVEGSVRRDGTALRITAQLVRVADGFHEWSESWDRELNGVFALQDEIARRIGEQLQGSLGGPTSFAPPPRAEIPSAVYDDYLKARADYRARHDLPTAVRLLESVVARVPGFAAGWSQLALVYDVSNEYVNAGEFAALGDVQQKTEQAAQRALALDPASAMALHARGNVARFRFRYADALRDYQAAMRADPTYSDAREDYAETLFCVGRVAEAREAASQLVELEPYVIVFWERVVDAATLLDDRPLIETAMSRLRELDHLGVDAEFSPLEWRLVQARYDEAEQLLSTEAADPATAALRRELLNLLRWARRDPGADGAAALQSIRGERQAAKLDLGMAQYFAYVRGDVALIESLERSPRATRTWLFGYLQAPNARALIGNPRIRALLRQYGFVDYWRENGWPPGCRATGTGDFECSIAFPGSG